MAELGHFVNSLYRPVHAFSPRAAPARMKVIINKVQNATDRSIQGQARHPPGETPGSGISPVHFGVKDVTAVKPAASPY